MIHDLENEPKKQGFRAYFTVGVVSFLVIAAAVIFFFLLFRLDTIRSFFHKLTGILQPIIIGFVIAYLLSPIMDFFERQLIRFVLSKSKKDTVSSRISSFIRGIAIFLSLLIAFFLIYILGSLIIPEIYVSITGIIKDMPGHIDMFTNWINHTLDNNQLVASYVKEGIVKITDYFENWVETDLLSKVNTWVNYFATGVIGIINIIKNLLIGIIVSVYILIEKEHFAAQGKMIIYALFKTHPANVIIETLRQSNKIFGGFIMGKIIDSMIMGVLCFIGLSFFKMPYTLLVSVIVGVTNVIPFFGPYFGAIPSAILILFIDPMKCLYFLIFILVLQQIDGNIIGPTILGDSTGLSAFWVIFSILAAGGLFGLIGMLIGVPFFAVVYYIVSTYIEYRLSCKNLKSTSEAYRQLEHIDIKTGKSIYKDKLS
ncbi:AI-2E family transporter [Acetivibrio ethanolgignens]|uniref:Permease n=1 Tax=Acetivibrio ethanolgignens TaxID=290052 RepID=A0A0V8QIJ7_9FIRM|nr:AI-2E family transporter [Acetivibrio ethanolgignens]KSV60070.1 hypothetical protein ASU35_06595 [Acetivibrio ethanolgignens]